MDRPDEELAKSAARGDSTAFRCLLERHGGRVFQVCFRITGDAHAAEDATQEAFLSAYRSLGGFEGRSRFATWLHRIAVNAALQLVRRERGWETRRLALAGEGEVGPGRDGGLGALVDDRAPGPEREAASRLAGEATLHALQALTALERLAFVLRHGEQLAVRDVAARLCVTESAVKQAVLRAVRKLRVALADHQELQDHG